MTPAAAAAPRHTPRPISHISRNSQKRRKTQDAKFPVLAVILRKENVILQKYFFIYLSMGYTGTKM